MHGTVGHIAHSPRPYSHIISAFREKKVEGLILSCVQRSQAALNQGLPKNSAAICDRSTWTKVVPFRQVWPHYLAVFGREITD